MQRLVVQGRRRDIGLGSVNIVSLDDARETALRFRRIARSGGDTIAERRKAIGNIISTDIMTVLSCSPNPKHFDTTLGFN